MFNFLKSLVLNFSFGISCGFCYNLVEKSLFSEVRIGRARVIQVSVALPPAGRSKREALLVGGKEVATPPHSELTGHSG